ncbi:MAG: YscQ/HrcQ family type III secretion apparatus protein [Comamonadaceae bacterium]|nr:MAG: YscQ/HrcQ family type III secretion apparatus protein [Comamonadaceae bacterium]
MSHRLALREADPATCLLRNEVLKARVANSQVSHLDRKQSYVSMGAVCGDRQHRVFVALQPLIDFWLGDASVPAERIDRDIALHFMSEALLEQGLPSPSEAFQWHSVIGFATADDMAVPLVHMQGGPFELYLDHVPDIFHQPVAVSPDLPIDIRWVVGKVTLPCSALVDLGTGDVIRVPLAPGILHTGNTPLFSFVIQGDFLMIDELEPEHVGHPVDTDDTDIDATAPIALEALPVTVSFVLGRRTMPVADISSLQPGMTLSLDYVSAHVDVMAGGRVLARGELVRIGETLGVEIQQTMPPIGAEPADLPS